MPAEKLRECEPIAVDMGQEEPDHEWDRSNERVSGVSKGHCERAQGRPLSAPRRSSTRTIGSVNTTMSRSSRAPSANTIDEWPKSKTRSRLEASTSKTRTRGRSTTTTTTSSPARGPPFKVAPRRRRDRVAVGCLCTVYTVGGVYV